jgi:hypothetical protein
MPDATFTGDNRDLHLQTPVARAHFHAVIDDPHFPGEQMSPYAMRSDSRRLPPGGSMEFRMTWELSAIRSGARNFKAPGPATRSDPPDGRSAAKSPPT